MDGQGPPRAAPPDSWWLLRSARGSLRCTTWISRIVRGSGQ
jgi:hypothetical protein